MSLIVNYVKNVKMDFDVLEFANTLIYHVLFSYKSCLKPIN